MAPCGEAVHIHLVALDVEGNQNANQGSCAQAKQRENRIEADPLTCQGRSFMQCGFMAVQLQMGNHTQSKGCVDGTEYDQPRPEGCGDLIRFCGRLVKFLNARDDIPSFGKYILRQGLHLDEGKVIKGGRTLAFAAVSADTGVNRYLSLIISG